MTGRSHEEMNFIINTGWTPDEVSGETMLREDEVENQKLDNIV